MGFGCQVTYGFGNVSVPHKAQEANGKVSQGRYESRA